ncbi:MAG: glycosyltransferase family 4 protein [Chitinophagaceae bacterium]|nr:glycosyltransferase family 4 protein [Chitinophagaceae bacterium]
MNKDLKHIVFIIANNSSVPYFLWFAEQNHKTPAFKFSFVCLHHSQPALIEEVKKFNCDCYWIPFFSEKRKTSMIKAIPKLVSLLKKIKPDIVHSHLFDDSLPTVIASKIAGIKHRIVTKQDTTFHWYYAPKAVKYDRLINKFATKLIAVSNECKDFIINCEKADPKKIVLIHHGIPLDKLSNATEKHKTELISRFHLEQKVVVGTVARLIEWKGHRILLEVLEKLVNIYPTIVFLFAGEGELKEEIIEIVRNKNLEKHVVLTGWIDREQIPSLYAIMDIYIHAAKYEPFGFVIAEAMLNGTPVLSTKTGSALDAIQTGENGYLVDYDNVDQFVEGVTFLLNQPDRTIGLKGKETATNMYSFQRMWDAHISLYHQCLNKN